jgi:UDP-N-acetylglucosamine--N-acetylmuramyl-(pentapeptide) pyrophosphoryl-undecaprenol N-acetylglucosamine transferase
VRDSLDVFSAEGIQIYCVTGMGKGRDGVMERDSKTGTVVKSHFVAFSDRIGELLSAADLVVSRAGAGTLAELIRCETPAVLVPFPQAADDHQRANAAFFEQQGGGLVVEQTKLATLRTEVLEILGNDWLLRQFRSNLQRMDRANSLDLMLHDLEQIIAPPAASSDSTEQVIA